jgi:hypothetical protein
LGILPIRVNITGNRPFFVLANNICENPVPLSTMYTNLYNSSIHTEISVLYLSTIKSYHLVSLAL